MPECINYCHFFLPNILLLLLMLFILLYSNWYLHFQVLQLGQSVVRQIILLCVKCAEIVRCYNALHQPIFYRECLNQRYVDKINN